MTTSLDRTLALWDLRTRRRLWSVAGLGGFAYAVSLKPEDPFAVAVACGDGTVRAADPRIGFEPTTSEAHASDSDNVLWRGLVQTKTTCMAWYPADDDGDEPHPRAGSFVVGLEDGRVVDVDPAAGDAGRYAVQRDCHGGPVTRAQWVFRSRGVSNAPPVRELVTLGDGRAWRWTELASPGGGVRARPGSGSGSGGGGFVDVTMRFHDADTTGEMTTFEFTDDGAFVAVGWSDGSVTTHRRDDSDENPNAFAFATAWRATEFGKRVTAVRWHPDATDANSPRFGWVGATSADGGFMVFDREGRVVRSAPRCRQGLLDLAWRPPSGSGHAAESGAGSAPAPDDRGGDAVAATAGADGLARVWNVTNAPALVAVMRGHEGRVLCLCWTRPGALSRGARAALLTGSDDQTVRRWDPDDPRHSPAVAAEAAARAKTRAVVAVLPDADANERKETDASMSDASAADGETPPVARGDASGSDPDASALPRPRPRPTPTPRRGRRSVRGPPVAGSSNPRRGRARPRVSPPVAPPPSRSRVRSPRARNRPGTRGRATRGKASPRTFSIPRTGTRSGGTRWSEFSSGRTFPGTVREDSVCFSVRRRRCVCCVWRSARRSPATVRAAPGPAPGNGTRRGRGRWFRRVSRR